MKVSEHFEKKELACPCCGLYNMSLDVIDLLEAVRETIKLPMKINSATRCKNHNKKVKGSPTSAHLFGLAADIHCPTDAYKRLLVDTALAMEFEGIGIYSKMVHLDLKKRKSGKVLFWGQY